MASSMNIVIKIIGFVKCISLCGRELSLLIYLYPREIAVGFFGYVCKRIQHKFFIVCLGEKVEG